MLSGISPLKQRWRWVAEAAGRCRYADMQLLSSTLCLSETRLREFLESLIIDYLVHLVSNTIHLGS